MKLPKELIKEIVDDSLRKMLFLVAQNITKKRTIRYRDGDIILSRLK